MYSLHFMYINLYVPHNAYNTGDKLSFDRQNDVSLTGYANSGV